MKYSSEQKTNSLKEDHVVQTFNCTLERKLFEQQKQVTVTKQVVVTTLQVYVESSLSNFYITT